MDSNIIDQATAQNTLRTVRNNLNGAITTADDAINVLRDLIIRFRTSGVITVEDMAKAVGRNRNYIDSVWSNYGQTRKGGQTRVAVIGGSDAAREAAGKLSAAAGFQRKSADLVTVARAERDRVVGFVYASRLLGPSAIASEVGIDRNHVLRIARRAGHAPAHRQGSRNQYSDNAA